MVANRPAKQVLRELQNYNLDMCTRCTNDCLSSLVCLPHVHTKTHKGESNSPSIGMD